MHNSFENWWHNVQLNPKIPGSHGYYMAIGSDWNLDQDLYIWKTFGFRFGCPNIYELMLINLLH